MDACTGTQISSLIVRIDVWVRGDIRRRKLYIARNDIAIYHKDTMMVNTELEAKSVNIPHSLIREGFKLSFSNHSGIEPWVE